jgi:predicted dinucleotide-binding enzyme
VTRALVATSQTSRVEIRLINGTIIFVPGDDADAIETVISAVGQLSAVAGCDAGGLNDREEDIAC